MNIEEQRLDLCNVKTKTSMDDEHRNTTFGTDGVRISELIVDADRQTVESMPQLADNLQEAEGDNCKVKDTLEIDEVNGNRLSADRTGSPNPTDSFFPNNGDHKDNAAADQMKDPKDTEPVKLNDPAEDDDGGEMDMGVDLSLDESGVLEAEPTAVRSPPGDISDTSSQVVPAGSEAESRSDAQHPDESSGADHAVLYPTVEEENDNHKLSGKRVTFPSDDDIVSGAVEPKDPWRHAQNVTVDDILSSYKQACHKLNCKPIPKVLKQIQELIDLTQRNECLDLKGEKLDYKACESLEEVLKRVQFKVINLEQTNLDEDGASALFDMIEYYESATHLNISFNKHIGTRGWQAAAHMMRKTSSLQYLDARNTPLLDHSAPFVARALRISGSLAVLHLENAGLSGRPLMMLATALKMNMNLRELYLADNKLNGLQDSAQLGNLLKFNYNIQILDLRNNHILDSGLAYVCEGLKEQRKGLVTLVLWNNQLTHNGMGYLAAALPCTQSLETLNLGHNSVGNEGVHKLKDGLIANRSVLRLGLASTKVSCEGAVAVAEFIAESPRLLRLDLRENEIKTGGLMALSLALKVNTSLLRLDLDREPKKETVKSFIETQRALLAEIQNGCKRNFILAKEKEETEQMMRQSVSMAEIATEDGTREEEGEDSNDRSPEDKTESQEQPSGESGASAEVSVPPINLDSDSDTEDEEEVITKASSEPKAVQSPTPPQTEVVAPASSSSHVPPPPSMNTISGITVTNSPVPLGTPPSPGRCISVSSPGRGHKIFMVTRVESPPEPQAAAGHTDGASKRTLETSAATAKQIQPTQEEVHDDTTLKRTHDHDVIGNTLEAPLTSQQAPASPSSAQPEAPPPQTPCEELKEAPAVEESGAASPEATSGDAKEEIQTSTPTPDQLTQDSERQDDAKEVNASPPTVTEDDSHGPKPDGEHQKAEPDGQEVAQPVPADQPTSVTAVQAETEASADQGEPEVAGSLLPNGLKPEFSLHLLDTDGPKPGSCVMEHVSVSCTQDLEELLLEASLDTGRDAP
ncbi:protein phosphatase 1 regulatory subunit 37 [Syngnathus acus]|uniref:protein phosphatase 1 regulatory subunit 37 n=1 Tax=Syngnathus acus TaxID=161584 RepID=UPI001885B19A|nr:protein phosphatase 1 regulatory subunit 37 [Syngnathus acus]XP_037123252.1 protein phosphatase 1 regulatory subunit 37 [Syngnathus acus]